MNNGEQIFNCEIRLHENELSASSEAAWALLRLLWQKANFKDGNVFLLRCEERESLSWWFSLIKYNQILRLSATGEMQLTSKSGAAGCALLVHAQGAGSDG